MLQRDQTGDPTIVMWPFENLEEINIQRKQYNQVSLDLCQPPTSSVPTVSDTARPNLWSHHRIPWWIARERLFQNRRTIMINVAIFYLIRMYVKEKEITKQRSRPHQIFFKLHFNFPISTFLVMQIKFIWGIYIFV